MCVVGGGVSAAVEKATGSRREREREEKKERREMGLRDGDQTIAL